MSVSARRGVILTFVLMLTTLGFMSFFRVTEIRVNAPSGGDKLQRSAQTLVDQQGRFTTVWTVNTQVLQTKLQEADPSIAAVEIKRMPPRALLLSVSYHDPALVWLSGNQATLLDSQGVAISTTAAPPAGLPSVVDGSNVPITIGSRVVTARFVTYVRELVPALAKRGIVPRQLRVEETTLDLTVQTTQNYRLIMDTSRTVAEAMIDLDGVLRTLAPQKQQPSEYLDLRIRGKAYYK